VKILRLGYYGDRAVPILLQNLRYGSRLAVRNPGFTAVAVLTLGLGIGANTAMFSVVNAILLRPIPWENPDRLVLLREVNRKQGGDFINPSTANYFDWREQNHVFERMAHFRFVYFNLSDNKREPERVQGFRVSEDFFPLIGVKPALGRGFAAQDEQPGHDRVVLLSNGFWRRRYSADPGIVGRTITIEGESHTVAGVLPDFTMFRVLDREIEIYTPLALPAAALSRGDHSLVVYGRLRAGISIEQAQSEMANIAQRLADAYPKTNTGWSVNVAPLHTYTMRDRSTLQFLLAAAAFVLLIACANIASLTLARSVSRNRELAIRMALGAGRLRIVRELFAESVILALAGGAAGALLAWWVVAFLDRSISYIELQRMNSFRVDLRVLGFTVAISLLASLLFGLGPAVRSSRFEVNDLMARAGGRGVTARGDLGSLLILSEVALATMLLIGAAIAARSTLRLLHMNRNLDPHNVLTAQLWMPPSRYPSAAAERRFLDAVLDRMRSLPGVEAASVVNYPPLGILGTGVDFEIEGRPPPAPGEAMGARFQVIDPAYFRTLRLPLIAGRAFETGDADESRGVAIVSESFARRFFAGQDAIGRRIRPHFPGGGAYWYPLSANQPLRIVGVAHDVREDGIKDGDPPQMYLPYAQNPSRIMHLLVRTQGPPLAWAAAVRRAILEVDRDEPLFDAKTLDEITAQSFSRQSAFGAMLGAAAGLALLLAATGIHALLAWSVSRRTREIGIRMAIGAAQSDVVRIVLRQALQPALAGIAAGIGGAAALGAILRTLVVGADRFDSIAFAGSAGILALVTVVATVVPLVRAVRVDPINALRME
jgi:putative ABC transport system permease protein